MKGPKRKGRKEPPEKPGGKALERLQQFELERGVPAEAGASPEKPKRPANEDEESSKGAD